jgi:signal transduction histidine kinase
MSKTRKSAWRFLISVPLRFKIIGLAILPVLVGSLALCLNQPSPLLIAIGLLGGLALAYGLSLVLTEQVKSLYTLSHQIKAGNYSARAKVWANDEIGQAQAAFNRTIASLEQAQAALQKHNRELAAVNELSEALTLGQGVDAVVEKALKRVVFLMAADVGSIYLLEKEPARLRLKASQGFLPPEILQHLASADRGDGLMRSLLESGRIVAVEDLRTASILPRQLADLLAQAGFVSWVCAPLKMEGEVIGVYHLGKRGPRTFNSHDLALLEMVGNVVGSSLSNAQLLRSLRRSEAELRRALHRAVELQEDERKRLARELHDEVGQALTSILIRLKSLQEANQAEIVQRIDDLRALTAQTIEELRRIAMDLRPAALDTLGITAALRWYTQQCSERTGLDIQFSGPPDLERLSPGLELILYRVAQEGITNAIRHGKPQRIEVSLLKDATSIRLIVKDNGRGFNVALLDQGLGLIGMRERVELLNGIFEVKTSPGEGAQLCVEIPWKGG